MTAFLVAGVKRERERERERKREFLIWQERTLLFDFF